VLTLHAGALDLAVAVRAVDLGVQLGRERADGLALDRLQIEQGLSGACGVDDEPNACRTRSARSRSSPA
jgi:hypothetical protein